MRPSRYGRRRMDARVLPLLAGVRVLALAGVAEARPAGTGKDGRPNILVVMTDDQAAADVAQVPKGFDIWRGLLDVSAYDYYNFMMNLDGRLKAWGDSDFAHKLVQFASVEVSPNPGGLADVIKHLTDTFGPGPYHYWGAENPQDYSPDVTGEVTEGLVRREARHPKPFFIWWAPAAPHREDVSVTLMGRPGPDPRYRSATPPRRPTGCCPSRRASPSRTWTRSPRTSATTPRRCRRT